MTADHLVLAGSCDSATTLPLIQARAVSVGDCLQSTEGRAPVIATRVVQSKGIRSLVTLAGNLVVVNGIVASPFAAQHRISEAWYSIHRLVYSLLPSALSFKFLQQTSERFGELAASFL